MINAAVTCDEKKRLLDAYVAAAQLYTLAIKRLDASRPASQKEAIEENSRIAAEAYSECVRAREMFDEHIRMHRC